MKLMLALIVFTALGQACRQMSEDITPEGNSHSSNLNGGVVPPPPLAVDGPPIEWIAGPGIDKVEVEVLPAVDVPAPSTYLTITSTNFTFDVESIEGDCVTCGKTQEKQMEELSEKTALLQEACRTKSLDNAALLALDCGDPCNHLGITAVVTERKVDSIRDAIDVVTGTDTE